MKTKKRIPWWQKGVIYEIYTPSFMDSNGDGIGDLVESIQKVDYLNDGTPQSLGVDGLWYSSFFPSPGADGGYDISEHTDINPLFGSLEIFDRLKMEAEKRRMHIISDFVPNHTSSQHPWFIASRSSLGNPKRDWYIWEDPAPDGGPPTPRQSNFGGPAWSKDKKTGQYYYHTFFSEQADLNWRNKKVREAMFQVVRFWLDRGVGVRFDAVVEMMDRHLYMLDKSHKIRMDQYAMTSDELHDIFRQFRNLCDQYDDRVMIGETWAESPEELSRYYGKKGDEFHIPFNFFLATRPWNAQEVRSTVEETEYATPKGAWPSYVLGSHDIPRLATRYGADQARLVAMLLLTLRGTPILYYGDEIGMQNVDIPADRVRDRFGRDPERTPMQWDNSVNAGFTRAEPWLPVSDDYREVNVAKQFNDPTSLLTLYRRLIWLRKQKTALCLGSYRSVDTDNDEKIFAYTRQFGKEHYLVVLNFSKEEKQVALDLPVDEGSIIISTGLDRSGRVDLNNLVLRPHEGFLIEIKVKPR